MTVPPEMAGLQGTDAKAEHNASFLPQADMELRSDVVMPITPVTEELAEAVILPEDHIVPPTSQPAPRLISGIDLIDFSVGGLLPNKVYLVRGEVGVGKTIAGLQFLARGLEHEETGILITDQKPEAVLDQARSVGFSLDEAVTRNQLAILNPSSRYFELVESPADIQAIVEELGDYIRKIGARRLVIDPIYALINTQYSAYFALMVTQSLFNCLESLPTTTLLIAGDDEKDPELNPIARMLEHNACGVLELSNDPTTGGRLMRLTKLRYANSENLSAHYRILRGRGLINYRGDHELVSDITVPWEESPALSRSVLVLGASPEAIRRVRESLGDDYVVQAESDLQVGVERARKEKPGLVLVTPSHTIAAASAILDLASNSSSSIAFLSTTTHRKADRILYLRAGADDFISEPFSAEELRARIDALIRRSGRRLVTRDSGLGPITATELSALMDAADQANTPTDLSIMSVQGSDVTFAPEFDDRLQRNIAAVSKFNTPFALYWIKAGEKSSTLNQSLARICREGDILCHNRNGEFVALLTGTDRDGLQGFERRLSNKLGNEVNWEALHRGYELYRPGGQAESR